MSNNPNGYTLSPIGKYGLPVSNGCTCTWSPELGWSARHCDLHRTIEPPPAPFKPSPLTTAAAKWGTAPKFPRRESERAR